ncbi:hypothetical protein IFM89_022653 [Coptis chinensis]|uniref:ABC transporter domain-containing protein n=1 Tax=Coptis chinensis TaxID=261450 RepID=A0A835GYN5_9MAGN|nr:hypothetical protein IFM89_022653 [Coptis chinensis]
MHWMQPIAEKRAAEILFGLGFDKKMQAKKSRDFSGGWRMRIALARGLFMKSAILLLDEPKNHLDLEACVWLEEMLKKFDREIRPPRGIIIALSNLAGDVRIYDRYSRR